MGAPFGLSSCSRNQISALPPFSHTGILSWHQGLHFSFPSSNAATPNLPSFDRPNRLKGREEGIIRWGELLEKFRTVQERARRLQRVGGGGGDLDDFGSGDLRISNGAPDAKGQALEGPGPGRAAGSGRTVLTKEPPPAKAEPPAPKLRSGLGRQFGRLGGAVSGRGKRA